MIRINLAPPDHRPRRPTGAGIELRMPEVNLGLVFGIAWLVGAAAVGYWWWSLMSHEQDLVARIKQSTAELETLKARAGHVSKLKEQVAELRKRVDTIQELTKGQTRPVVLFDALADMVPRELWLNGLEERGSTLRISGTAYSSTAVADFMSNLRSSGRFKDVDIVVSRQDLSKTPTQVTFEVTCRFES